MTSKTQNYQVKETALSLTRGKVPRTELATEQPQPQGLHGEHECLQGLSSGQRWDTAQPQAS